MLDLVSFKPQAATVSNLRNRSRFEWGLWYLGILGVAGLFGFLMYRVYQGRPEFSWIAWLFLIITIALTLYRPRYGIYLSLFWGLVADQTMMPWYPFIKNFSSRETLLYLNDSVIFSPLELLLILTLVSWLLQDTMQRRWRIYRGPLFLPTLFFAGLICFGLVYGIGRGGNVNIALWESRAMFYMFLMIILVSNLFEKRGHITTTIWFIVAALTIKSIYGVYHLFFVLRGDLSHVESLTDHQAAIHIGVVFVLLVTFFLFKVAWRKRLVIIFLLLPLLITFMAAQRRSGFVALLIALLLIAVILFLEQRKAFWLIIPPLAFVGLAYIGAFWNSTNPLGGPAQAIKSVIDENEADYHDRASNDYRKIENFNSTFTIRQEPLTGVGFGNKFYIVIQMPDISKFSWWEYMPHNSVAYIWIKSGVIGFLSMLLFVGMAIAHGMRATSRIKSPQFRAIALTATLYVIMHFIYAYVDISWEAQGMMMLGVMVGIINCIEPIVAVDSPTPTRRWPWQPKPVIESPLRPLPAN